MDSREFNEIVRIKHKFASGMKLELYERAILVIFLERALDYEFNDILKQKK